LEKARKERNKVGFYQKGSKVGTPLKGGGKTGKERKERETH